MARYAARAWRNFRPDAAIAAPKVVGSKVVAGPTAVPAGVCRVLGLDPGSQRTGFGIIECHGSEPTHIASGCINVVGNDMVVRLRRIFEGISALVAEHRPDTIAIERVFVHRNPDSALKLGQARGVALCAAAALGAQVHEYAPRAIKRAVTGYGAAEKSQVSRMVCTLLALASTPGVDAADALAVALCHAHARRIIALESGAA
jgi:crossover junction endodeoxyribonuclease RuvC